MHVHPSIPLGLVLFASGCTADKVKMAARDEYCNELESSPVHVDSALDLAATALGGLQSNQEALESTLGRGEASSTMLWLSAGSCEMVAREWAEAAAEATALQRDWWDVRQATGVLTIEPPAAFGVSSELNKACAPPDMPMVPATPQDLARALRTAAKHRQAAQIELQEERQRWAHDRDAGMATCEASGWHRRHEPGYWQHAKPLDAGHDAPGSK